MLDFSKFLKRTIAKEINLFVIFIALISFVLLMYAQYLNYRRYNENIKTHPNEIINTISPLIYSLINKPDLLKSTLEQIINKNEKITYILLEKNGKYLLQVNNGKVQMKNMKIEPVTIKKLEDSQYTLGLSYLDKDIKVGLFSKGNFLFFSTIFFAVFFIVIFISKKLKSLTIIKQQLENIIPSIVNKEELKSIAYGVTNIIEQNKQNENALVILQKNFEEQLKTKTSSLLNEVKEKKKAKIQLENSINEKTLLLKEIHHRVKNNLAIVTGLIRMQARSIKDKDIKDKFLNLQNRIKTMELIHTNLYKSEDFTQINFKSYLYTLIENLQQSYDTNKSISYEISASNIKLTIEQAIACGQIINELVTNAFKYAFVGKNNGKISVKIENKNEFYILVISDNGIGLHNSYVADTKKLSLGMTIVKGLVKSHLKGRLEVINIDGVTYQILFKNLQKLTKKHKIA